MKERERERKSTNCLFLNLEDFYGLHRQDVLIKYAPRLKIGSIENEVSQVSIPSPGDLSAVPYAEPSYWMGFKSAYFK